MPVSAVAHRAVLAVALTLSALVFVGPASPASADATPVVDQPPGAASFRMSSFNVLGASHTDGRNPERKGWLSSAERLPLAKRILEQNGVQVVGFQELHKPQAEQWAEIAGDEWDYYPGLTRSEAAAHNSISWRRDKFTLISADVFLIPYFKGNPLPMPVIQLQDNATGQRAWFLNVHNPADTKGDAQKWRNEAVRIEIAKVNELRAADPLTPVFLTGDMNDTSQFFCPIVRRSELESASGGWADATTCTPPKPARIDWITGTDDAAFSSYVELRTPLVKRTTDHPVMLANATIAPLAARSAGIRNVVVVSADGLRPNALSSTADAARTGTLRRLAAEGAWTRNARLAYERSTSLPNTVSELTGRQVWTKQGGHGVTYDQDRGQTVHQAARQYVSGVFDIVHNNGARTALYSSRASAAMLARTWGKRNGGADAVGRDNGANKLSTYVRYPDRDRKVVQRAMRDLAAKPAAFSYVELSDLDRVGQKSGFSSGAYADALARFDRQVGGLVRTIERNPATAGRTLVVVTGGSQGTRAKAGKPRPSNYTTSLVVWGPGVVAGADLYDLNPDWNDPGSARRGYASNPIFTGVLANLALGALGMAPLPRATVNPGSSFNVFVDGAVVEPATP